MKVKEVSLEEYEKIVETLQKCSRVTPHNIDPIMRNMTVINKSGPGTPFKNEFERLKHEWLNPPIPVQVILHDVDGSYILKPRKKSES